MQLRLHRLCPLPLKERLQTQPSAVWLQDLTWDGGMHLFVQAPSGTGKTTLIHALYGLRNDYEGTISWGEVQDRSPETLAQLRAKDVSIIFQDLRLFPEPTLWENLEIKRRLTDTVDAPEARSWLARLGIDHKADAPAATLSYGEQQRTAIIRALLQPFQWLLMDEPFSHLDQANTRKAAALILEVVQRRQASFLLADLDQNDHLPYSNTLLL